ncbi:ABC transporter permease [Halobacillus salinarum]|uniref:ABC transporter permease n=1 Tax=Halobacillus salinarum TaxID=2932257 RepID=A0ABY4EHL7_9BACI|nr:ABC transporter permease [Halobacillus salinarum]UOQ43959.1 ABC transporter permease [Halobacillus salinarum]
MKWKDKRKFIHQNMKKNKSRVFMTTLATAIGCAFLIVLASVGFGAQRFIVHDLLQDRSLTSIEIHGKKAEEEGDVQGITNKDIENFEQLDHVKAVSRKLVLQNPAKIKLDDFQSELPVSVVDYPSEIKAGFKLDKGRMPETKNEVVVGYHFKSALHSAKLNGEELNEADILDESGEVKEQYQYQGKLLGKQIEMQVRQWKSGSMKTKTIPLKVVGVREEPAKDWEQDNGVLISKEVLNQVEKFTGTPLGAVITPDMSSEEKQHIEGLKDRTYNGVNVIADDMESVDALSSQLKGKGYYIYSVTEELEQVNLVFAVVKIGLGLIGLIALVIASIGIYNTMSMAVTERTHDIGIMKAIGGKPQLIRNIFLMESSYIGFMGAVVGVAAAYLVSFGVNQLMPVVIKQVFDQTSEQAIQLSYIPPYLVLICVAISIGTAILSGIKPANKATRIDVLSALRRDI